MSQQRTAPPSARWPLALGLLACVAFVVGADVWDRVSSSDLLYGDSVVHVSEVIGRYSSAQHHYSYDPIEIWGRMGRAPLMVWAGIVWTELVDGRFSRLFMVPTLLVALGAALTGLAVGRSRRAPWAGLVATVVILAAPQTLASVHCFHLGTAGMAFTGLALWGAASVHRGDRLGPLWLGLGLGLALISRHNTAASLVLPVVLWALPAGLALLFSRHGWRALPGVLLPVATVGAAIAACAHYLGWPLQEFIYMPPALGASVLICAPWVALRPGVKDPVGRRRDLVLALWVGCAVGLPYWISVLGGITGHYEGSSGGSHTSLSHAPMLWDFMAKVVVNMQLGTLFLPLLFLGLWQLLRRRDPVGMLALVGVLAAAGTWFLYFHSRYLFPLLPWVAVLCGAAVPARGRWAPALGGFALAVLGLRLAGPWLSFAHHLPSTSLSEEHISWYQWKPNQDWSTHGDMLHPLAVYMPVPGEDWLEPLTADAVEALGCTAERPCTLLAPHPDLGVVGLEGEPFLWPKVRLWDDGLHQRIDVVTDPSRAVIRFRLAEEAEDVSDGWERLPARPVNQHGDVVVVEVHR